MFGSNAKKINPARGASHSDNHSHRRADRWFGPVIVALARRAPGVVDRRPRRQAVTATLALAAVGLGTAAGVMAVGAGVESSSRPTAARASTLVPNDRIAAAQRADRSDRTAVPPAAAGAAKAPAKAPAKKAPAKKAAPKKAPAWVAPMTRFQLSSCFGRRWGAMHQGLDFAMPAGTPILAAGGGRVAATGWIYSGYGISVVIDHGRGYLTHYAHTSKVYVKPGQRVKAGQMIAREGSTGDSTGPHLHFEVHRGMWHQIDPAKFLRARSVKIGC